MRSGAHLLLAAMLAAGPLVGQEASGSSRPPSPRLTIRIRDTTGALVAPVVRAENLLSDGSFLAAIHNGFAVRFGFHLGLWRSAALFDRLVGETSWEAFALQDPVENNFVLVRADGRVERFPDHQGLGVGLSTSYTIDAVPPPRGSTDRYYYIVSLNVESLTASELEDVQRWLRGDLGPAITQRGGDVGNALTRGVRMLLIRLSGLPHRSFEVRSEEFRP